jgi:hypothetical protein
VEFDEFGGLTSILVSGFASRVNPVCAEGDFDVSWEGLLHDSGYAGRVSADGLYAAEDEDGPLSVGPHRAQLNSEIYQLCTHPAAERFSFHLAIIARHGA